MHHLLVLVIAILLVASAATSVTAGCIQTAVCSSANSNQGTCPKSYFITAAAAAKGSLSPAVKEQFFDCVSAGGATNGAACCADPCGNADKPSNCLELVDPSDGASRLCTWMPMSSGRFTCISKFKLCLLQSNSDCGKLNGLTCFLSNVTGQCSWKMADIVPICPPTSSGGGSGSSPPPPPALQTHEDDDDASSSSSSSSSICNSMSSAFDCYALNQPFSKMNMCIWNYVAQQCSPDPCAQHTTEKDCPNKIPGGANDNDTDSKTLAQDPQCVWQGWNTGAPCFSRSLLCTGLTIDVCSKSDLCDVLGSSSDHRRQYCDVKGADTSCLTTSAPANNKKDDDVFHKHIGLMIGCAIGGVVLLGGVMYALYRTMKKEKKGGGGASHGGDAGVMLNDRASFVNPMMSHHPSQHRMSSAQLARRSSLPQQHPSRPQLQQKAAPPQRQQHQQQPVEQQQQRTTADSQKMESDESPLAQG